MSSVDRRYVVSGRRQYDRPAMLDHKCTPWGDKAASRLPPKGRDGGFDFILACTRKSRSRFKPCNGAANELMNQFAESDRVELERFRFQTDRAPAQGVSPHEAKRITQKAL